HARSYAAIVSSCPLQNGRGRSARPSSQAGSGASVRGAVRNRFSSTNGESGRVLYFVMNGSPFPVSLEQGVYRGLALEFVLLDRGRGARAPADLPEYVARDPEKPWERVLPVGPAAALHHLLDGFEVFGSSERALEKLLLDIRNPFERN